MFLNRSTLMITLRAMVRAAAVESLAEVSQMFLSTPCLSVSSWL